jgi:hypothetical protein
MLAAALFYIALIALVATTILSAGLSMTRMTIARMSQPYLAAGYQRALTGLQEQIAAEMRSGGVPYPAPTFTPMTATCANASCTYKTAETLTLAETVVPTPGPSCDPAQSSCASNVQLNAYVAESRLTAAITVILTDVSGSVVAQRSGIAVLRTFKAPPYVAIAGSREGTFDDVVGTHAAGDDGGAPPATPNACTAATAGASDDTTVRVAYHNTATAACSDGSAWGSASYNSGGSSSGWSR